MNMWRSTTDLENGTLYYFHFQVIFPSSSLKSFSFESHVTQLYHLIFLFGAVSHQSLRRFPLFFRVTSSPLMVTLSSSTSALILGNFNTPIHIDHPPDLPSCHLLVSQFLDLLSNVLVLHLTSATHTHGHTLNVAPQTRLVELQSGKIQPATYL